jgi:hypothetical protein
MDNPEKRTTKVQEDEEKQRENTTLNVLVTIIHKQTLSRSKHKGNRSNSGGYIYSILGDGKSLELTKQIKSNKEVFIISPFRVV